jgi:hypothetical protein
MSALSFEDRLAKVWTRVQTHRVTFGQFLQRMVGPDLEEAKEKAQEMWQTMKLWLPCRYWKVSVTLIVLTLLSLTTYLYLESIRPEIVPPPLPLPVNPARDWKLLTPAAPTSDAVEATTNVEILNYNPHHPAPSFTVVLACNSDARYFALLENAIGSVHFHAPNHRIRVYDLGLTAEQVAILNTFLNVRVISLAEWHTPRVEAEKPPHLLDMTTRAYKPVVMLDALTRGGHSQIFYLDVTLQLASYPARVESILKERGHLFVANYAKNLTALERTHPTTLQVLGFDQAEFTGKPLIQSGIQAYRSDSPVVESILKPAVKCALDANCIAPQGAVPQSHHYASSIFSALLHHSSLPYEHSPDFSATPEIVKGKTQLELKKLVVFRPVYDTPKRVEGIGKTPWRKSRTYVDAIIKRVNLAMVQPFVEADLPQLHEQWTLIEEYQPCRLPTTNPVDLIFFNANTPNAALEEELRQMINALSSAKVRACFRNVYMQYASLSEAEDRYPAGPNYMFQRLLSHPTIRLRQYGYTHMLLAEADLIPVRKFWLDALVQVVKTGDAESKAITASSMPIPAPAAATPPAGAPAAASPSSSALKLSDDQRLRAQFVQTEWWMLGGVYKGDISVGDWMFSVNGNALYHLSSELVEYTHEMWTEFDIRHHPYDCALMHYMTGHPNREPRGVRQREMGLYWHKFVFTDHIQNCWHSSCGEHVHFLLDNPQAYLVHSSANYDHNPKPSSGWFSWLKLPPGTVGWLLFLLKLLLVVVPVGVWWLKRGRHRMKATRARAPSNGALYRD